MDSLAKQSSAEGDVRKTTFVLFVVTMIPSNSPLSFLANYAFGCFSSITIADTLGLLKI